MYVCDGWIQVCICSLPYLTHSLARTNKRNETNTPISYLRSLGVHISFVRSIAMDSWTDPQLKLMKCGGNQKCADYLSTKGVASGTAIKPKYESDAAQLYKAVLKARAEGRPEPTELVKKPPRNNSGYASSMSSSASAGSSMHGGGTVGKAGEDPNGMERLAGETDAQYVARQTRLRDEAKARMAAKFGGGGGGGGMGGVGSSGGGMGGMGGIGSDSSYNPATGGYGGGGMGGSVDVNAVTDSLVSGFGTALGALGSAATAATTTASSFVADPGTQQTLTSLKSSAGGLAGGFWGSLSAGASAVASAVTAPDDTGDDGLADLQRQFSQQRGTQPSKYAGFGSDSASASVSTTTSSHSYGNTATSTFSSSAAAAAPAPAPSSSGAMTRHLPGEDPNGMERLTGETDEQYVARQTRLRDEAKARMAAKFGGGGMGGVGSSGPSSSGGGMMGGMGSMMGGIMGGMMGAPAPAPAAPAPMSAPAPKLPTAASRAPASGNSMQGMKKKMQNSDDFFASFGS